MERILVEEEDGIYRAKYILEFDVEGNSAREFEAVEMSKEEALSLLTRIISKSSLDETEKENILEEIQNVINNSYNPEEKTKLEFDNKDVISDGEKIKEDVEILDRANTKTEGNANAPNTIQSRDKAGKRVKKDS